MKDPWLRRLRRCSSISLEELGLEVAPLPRPATEHEIVAELLPLRVDPVVDRNGEPHLGPIPVRNAAVPAGKRMQNQK